MAHDSFEEDYELASGNSFHISQAQAAEWHTRLVEAEKEIVALRAAAEKAREALSNLIPLASSAMRDANQDCGEYMIDKELSEADATLAALEEVLK